MTNRERLLHLIDNLSEKQIDEVLHIVENIQETEDVSYDETLDPAIDLFSGPVDASERVEEILKKRSQRYSGWTRKRES